MLRLLSILIKDNPNINKKKQSPHLLYITALIPQYVLEDQKLISK